MEDEQDTLTPGPAQGLAVLIEALRHMPLTPGVYRMLDGRGDALYVGKARSLRKRVTQYTQTARLPERLRQIGRASCRERVCSTV